MGLFANPPYLVLGIKCRKTGESGAVAGLQSEEGTAFQ